MQPASVWRRAAARVFDALIMVVLGALASLAGGIVLLILAAAVGIDLIFGDHGEELGPLLAALMVMFALVLVYRYEVVATARRGQTWGKRLMDIEVAGLGDRDPRAVVLGCGKRGTGRGGRSLMVLACWLGSWPRWSPFRGSRTTADTSVWARAWRCGRWCTRRRCLTRIAGAGTTRPQERWSLWAVNWSGSTPKTRTGPHTLVGRTPPSALQTQRPNQRGKARSRPTVWCPTTTRPPTNARHQTETTRKRDRTCHPTHGHAAGQPLETCYRQSHRRVRHGLN